jgi:hypothetical protein
MGLEPTTPCLQSMIRQIRDQASRAKPQVAGGVGCPPVTAADPCLPMLRARRGHEIPARSRLRQELANCVGEDHRRRHVIVGERLRCDRPVVRAKADERVPQVVAEGACHLIADPPC